MAFDTSSLVKAGTVAAGSGSSSPAFGQSTTAGNLLICFAASGGGTSLSISGTGWNTGPVENNTTSQAAIFWKANCAAGETAPTVNGSAGVNIFAQLVEYTATDDTIHKSKTSATSPITAASADTASGGVMVTADQFHYASAVTIGTRTDTYNNATEVDLGNNDASSTVNHYSFAYGITTANSVADKNTVTNQGSPASSAFVLAYFLPAVQTTQTQLGKARIQLTTTKTQTGKARITATTTETQAGKARVTKTTTQTQTGVSRITATTLQTTIGKALITNKTLQTSTGVSRITATTPRTIRGLGRITVTTVVTISGVARITNTATKTISGVANIAIGATTTTKTITGLARITNTSTKTITGVTRVTATTKRTITGKALIMSTVPPVCHPPSLILLLDGRLALSVGGILYMPL